LYQEFYNLKECPFSLSPDPGFLYMTTQHREALSGLIYNTYTHAGLTMLLGEAGTGKTTLLYCLLGLLQKRQFVATLCTNPTLTREEFYDLLMLKFGVQCESTLKSRQLLALQDLLLRNRADGRPSVLIVDEAQRLPLELLEEIRLLLNLETPQEKLLEIVMSGQPELGDILNRPELRQLKQRVSCICKLMPLTLEELREYLHHRLSMVGLPRQTLFSAGTIQLIFEYTKGIPRLVNNLCNAALQTGFAMQAREITVSIIEEAARDLELQRSTLEQPLILRDEIIAKLGSPESSTKLRPVVVNGNTGTVNGKFSDRVPLESYASRQKSLGFLAGLMDRLI
jgi:general secretion pathway protein A